MADPIEEHLRKAAQEGKFNDLPGQGKPLKMDENPHEDPDWRLANHILRSSGFTLPWIELGQEIDGELEATRRGLQLAWEHRQQAPAGSFQKAEAEWKRTVEAFRGHIETLNHKIMNYNLQTPALQLQRMSLDSNREIRRVQGGSREASQT